VKLYCLSGLGVDHRAFRNLQIDGVELVHIPWIKPQKNESLPSYAQRLFGSANLPEEYHLIGVSFGGMIAQEFEKIRKPKSLFLVSTISSSTDLTGAFRLGGKLKLYKLIPRFLINRGNFLANDLFGVKSKVDKQLFNEILRDSDIPLIRWALGAILQWKNDSPSNGLRIHGGKDKVLPHKGATDFFMPKAGHFMIATHGKEVSAFVKSELQE
jgi:pimeloyl-ACP methyl ester carboxylesterase